MKIERILVAIVLAAVLIVPLSMFVNSRVHAQDQGQSTSAETNQILGKLNEIATGQRAIMEQIASIKEELNVIKIRVTQSQ